VCVGVRSRVNLWVRLRVCRVWEGLGLGPLGCIWGGPPSMQTSDILKSAMSHVGRRTLGDDLGFVRGEAKRGACAVGWGFWEPSEKELGDDVEGNASEEVSGR
jgi:hypothetical protein